MKKIVDLLGDLGLKITGAKEDSPFFVTIYYMDGYANFFTKYFFTGPKGNVVSKHDGKFVVSISPLSVGYYTGKLIEKDSYFLFKQLPSQLEIDGKVYRLSYKKDVWGW